MPKSKGLLRFLFLLVKVFAFVPIYCAIPFLVCMLGSTIGEIMKYNLMWKVNLVSAGDANATVFQNMSPVYDVTWAPASIVMAPTYSLKAVIILMYAVLVLVILAVLYTGWLVVRGGSWRLDELLCLADSLVEVVIRFAGATTIIAAAWMLLYLALIIAPDQYEPFVLILFFGCATPPVLGLIYRELKQPVKNAIAAARVIGTKETKGDTQ